MIRDLEEKFEQLTAAYQRLNVGYGEIASYGQKEENLIVAGQMDSLLAVLRDKEQLIVNVYPVQEEARKLQDFLVDYYDLETFSVPDLLAKTDPQDHHLINNLQQEINKLITLLESLEGQEHRHERMLQQYTDILQTQVLHQPDHKVVKKAYRKFSKSETHENK